MSDTLIQTTAWVLGDDVNTDLNCSGKYLPGKDESYIAAHAFEAVDPSFVQRFKSGDIIVAGTHFGINSSREQAVHILRRMGVAAIVAPSFGRQFFRNAINNGLLVLECDTTGLPNGASVRLDLQAHTFGQQPPRRFRTRGDVDDFRWPEVKTRHLARFSAYYGISAFDLFYPEMKEAA